MAAWMDVSRQAANLTRLSTSKSTPPTTRQAAACLIQQRGLAGSGDHHGPPKVNIWEDPTSPSKWKEEHFVIASLTGWGLLIFGVTTYKFFTGRKKDRSTKDEKKAKSL